MVVKVKGLAARGGSSVFRRRDRLPSGCLLVVATSAVLTSAGDAQQSSAPADSAAVARSAWSRATAAFQRDDLAIARREMDRAAHRVGQAAKRSPTMSSLFAQSAFARSASSA